LIADLIFISTGLYGIVDSTVTRLGKSYVSCIYNFYVSGFHISPKLFSMPKGLFSLTTSSSSLFLTPVKLP
jgi:hypothetical protein